MNKFVLDTSICVAILRGNQKVADRMKAVGVANCYITDIVIAELLFGAYKSDRTAGNLRQVRAFIGKMNVLPFPDSVDMFAQERLKLWRAGRKIDDFDLLVGCAAKVKGLTVVTHNVKHFEHIEDLDIVDWVKQDA